MNLLRRPRRLRVSAAMRTLVRETSLEPHQFILPFFVSEKLDPAARNPVTSMPGVFQLGLDALVEEVGAAYQDGVSSVLLFGIPREKDEVASQAYAADGIVQRAVRA